MHRAHIGIFDKKGWASQPGAGLAFLAVSVQGKSEPVQVACLQCSLDPRTMTFKQQMQYERQVVMLRSMLTCSFHFQR